MDEPKEQEVKLGSRFRGNDEEADPGSGSGMTKGSEPPLPAPAERERGRREPAWVRYFLKSLERTGDVRASAEEAGIDHTTAYARRRAHADFASNWEWVLQAHAERVEREEEAEVEAIKAAGFADASHHHAQPSPGWSARGAGFADASHHHAQPSPGWSARGAGFADASHHHAQPSPGWSARGDPLPQAEEIVASGDQLKRAGHDRWSGRKEKLFFDELAATANVKRSARAAGVSPNAVYARRLRDPHFKAKWAAVLETGRASIEMHLVEAANRSFDPEELDVGDVAPKVSVAEAIRITQSNGSKKQEPADAFDDPDYDYEDDIASIREGLVQKLQALRRRDRPELLARGWSYDESWDREIPPGWAKTPDWRPMEDSDKYWRD